jgi:hypothetical protein
MLLKWLFTLLAIIWLYQALRPMFAIRPPHAPRPVNRPPEKDDDRGDGGGEYIDYEEIK